MSFEINPNMNPRNVGNSNKTEAMNNDGRGASGGGAGYSASAFGEAEPEGLEDELILSSVDDKDIDEETQENLGTLWNTVVTFFKRLFYKFIKSIS